MKATDLSDDDRDAVRTDVLEMMKQVYQSSHETTTDDTSDFNDTEQEALPMSPRTAAIQAAIDADEARIGSNDVATGELMVSLRQELDQYLSKRCLHMKKDPLQWWKENKHVYPNLSAVAKQYLAIPASSASSECSAKQTY